MLLERYPHNIAGTQPQPKQKKDNTMSDSDNNPPTAEILQTLATLFTATKKRCVKWSDWENLTLGENTALLDNLCEYITRGCPKLIVLDNGFAIDPPPKGDELIRFVLANDYITSEDTCRIFGWQYSDVQLDHFAKTLPDRRTLRKLRENDYILFAAPPKEMNLLDITKQNDAFFRKEGCHGEPYWFSSKRESFARTDKVASGKWLAIRRNKLVSSLNKTMKEQQALLAECEYVPNVAESAYLTILYYRKYGISLFADKSIKTSSISASGPDYVLLSGSFGQLSLINYDGGCDCSKNPIAPAMKL